MYIDEAEIKKQIREASFSNLYLICGDEPYLKQFYAGKIVDKAINKDFSAFNLHTFDGSTATIKDISDSIESIPMMDEKSCVVIKDMPLDKLNESERKDIESIISDIPETSVTVFLLQNISFGVKKEPKWEKIISLFAKYGSVLQLNKKSVSDLCRILIGGAEKRGCALSKQNAEYLVRTVGDDMNNLLNELEKLCYYKKDSEITKDVIDSLAIKSISARIYDLTNELVLNHHETAFSILNTLIAQKEEPIVINSQLISAYVDMYRVKVFMTAGEKYESVKDYYNYRNRAFVLKNASVNCSKISVQQIRKCLDILANTDEKLKSTAVNKHIILEETMIKLMLAANGENVCVN